MSEPYITCDQCGESANSPSQYAAHVCIPKSGRKAESTEIIPQPSHTETELSRFDRIEAAIAEIKADADAITVIDHTDKENAQKARKLRLTIKPQRIEADKIRKELKADGLKFLDMIERRAQSVIKPMTAIESGLQEKEDIVLKHAEREAEKERQRVAAEAQKLEVERQQLERERAEHEQQVRQFEQQKVEEQARATVAWDQQLHPKESQAIAQADSTTDPLKIRVYYHASKESLWEEGQAAGLSQEALKLFMFAGEIGVDLFVRPDGEVIKSVLAS